MPRIGSLFGRPAGPAKVDVADLVRRVGVAAAVQVGPADLPLVRARLADRCRDAGREPVRPDEFDALDQALDDEAERRLAVLVRLLDGEPNLLAAVPPGPTPAVVHRAFFDVAGGTPLLTLDVLARSELRAEELARRFVAALGLSIQGETPDASRQRLERIDSGRLMTEVEAAKAAAEGRMEKFRQKLEEQDQRTRRGKW